VGIVENAVDNDFLLAVSSGKICRHLRDLVIAGKNTEDINDRKGSDLKQKFLAGIREIEIRDIF